MDKQLRKPNRLKNYDYSSNGMYFITVCTKNREHILCEIGLIVGDSAPDVPCTLNNGKSIRIKLTRAGEAVNKYILSADKTEGVTIDKYVIMPNHIHMIIAVSKPIVTKNTGNCNNGTSRAPSPTNMTIPRVIAVLKRLVNKEMGENIFQRSYHDHIIRDEHDYEKIWEYIDTNPQKWEADCFYSE